MLFFSVLSVTLTSFQWFNLSSTYPFVLYQLKVFATLLTGMCMQQRHFLAGWLLWMYTLMFSWSWQIDHCMEPFFYTDVSATFIFA